MIPRLEDQLLVSLKVLNDVVRPALGGEDPVAQEQLSLAIATIGMVRDRLGSQDGHVRADLRDTLGLAHAIADAGSLDLGEGDGSGPVAAAESRATDPDASVAELRESAADVAALCSAAVRSCPDETFGAVARAVLDRSEGMAWRARLWCAPAGFEVLPEASPAPRG